VTDVGTKLGTTDRPYVIAEALLQVIDRDKRFKGGHGAATTAAQTGLGLSREPRTPCDSSSMSERANPRTVADLEIVFEEGAVCGLRLVGGSQDMSGSTR